MKARTSKAQSAQIIASVAIAMLMFILVAAYVSSQRLIIAHEQSPIPPALRHLKADIDSDYSTLFCDAGLCITSTHSNDALISFNLNYHAGFFSSISNFTGSYNFLFDSSRLDILTSELAAALSSGRLLLGETATGSNYSLYNYNEGNLSLNFNSSTVTAYSLHYDCENTSSVLWTPDLYPQQDIELSFTLPSYTQPPTNTSTISLSPDEDGSIRFDGTSYVVENSIFTSSMGFDNKDPREYENRTYLSFNTSVIPDDSTILIAHLFVYVDSYAVSSGTTPSWIVDYKMGPNIIGTTLTSEDWGDPGFVSAGTLDYAETTGWKDFVISQSRNSDISVTGQTDFELVGTWAGSVQNNKLALVSIRETEYAGTSYDPYVTIQYEIPGGPSMNRSLNYSTSYNSTCGVVNISIIQGNIYTNFSYQNVSINATIPTNNSLGVFLLHNMTTFNAPGSAFSSICLSGTEPEYPSAITDKTYGSFSVSDQTVNMILAKRSGSFNTAYLDTNGNCNFTDFTDEYFTIPGEWLRLGDGVARLDSIAPDGASVTFTFASAGMESTLLNARLTQPIYLNK